MNCCATADLPICPCGQFVHPRTIANPPSLDAIAYRVGDYASFRHALLLSLPGEIELARWRPGAQGDLAVQMVEWWAYLADILTFYNERIAAQAYLRTADRPESVNRLIRLLGYRPRPGTGATGLVAALTTGVKPFTLPAGFQIQSKAGPGKTPQIFELDRDVTITPPIGTTGASGSTNVGSAPTAAQKQIGADNAVLLAGAASAIKKGDRVLLLPIANGSPGSVVASATAVTHEKDALGKPITRIALDADHTTLVTKVTDVTQFRILASSQSAQVWQYPAKDDSVIFAFSPFHTITFFGTIGTGGFGFRPTTLQVDLASVVRGLKTGDPIVFEGPDATLYPQFGNLTNSTEAIWFANPGGYDPTKPTVYTSADPAIGPDPTKAPPIPIPHTRITFGWAGAVNGPTDTMAARPGYLVRYGWKEVGPLIAATGATVGGPSGGGLTLQAAQGTPLGNLADPTVLVEDVNGNGAAGAVLGDNQVQIADPVPVLVPPLRILTNLLPVSRGKTVANEVLGNGNALIAGQDFVLQNAPVTYLQSADSTSGENYKSTVRVWVNQLEWAEVSSFYGQPPGAQVFLTREDDAGKTHIVFGDGDNGARLPTGVNNVTASYRYGSGAEVPAVGSLTVVLQPQPGLRAIRNPVAVGGGADPDAPDKVRKLAPRSVLTFGRAVSMDDFQTIAAQTPGVARAKAAVAFDALAQRPRVTVWVGDETGAVDAARAAIVGAADPNRLPRVVLARALVIRLSLTLMIDRRRDADMVQAAVRSALVDVDAGLFGVNTVGIGQAYYDSQIYASCLAVPGVTAVHSLQFEMARVPLELGVIRTVGLFKLFGSTVFPEPTTPNFIVVTVPRSTCCGQRHDPGEGAFFFLLDSHLSLAKEAAP